MIKRKYKFFDSDIIKFKYSTGNMYFRVLKDPDNIFKSSYEQQPWEVYENTVNNCWRWDKITKVQAKYKDVILKYFIFRKVYKGLK